MTETKWYMGPVYVLVSLALVLSFSLMPATTSMVSAQGATGKFTTGNPPTVEIIFTNTTMQPLWEMDVPVDVTNGGDRNLSELYNVTFLFWYDANGGDPTGSEFNSTPVSTQDCIGIEWDNPDGFSGLIATDTPPYNASWVLLTCTAPADLDVTNGIFWFNFTIGKVARKTVGEDKWQIAASAWSTSHGWGFGYDAEGVTTMNFYEEVFIAANTTVDWGIVPAGLGFAEDGDSEEPLGASVFYIANGNYTENVSTDAVWTPDATLDATGACAYDQNFSLMADNTGAIASAVLVDVSPGVTIATGAITGDNTTDGGSANVEAANTLWLALAANFTTATYTGTITYSAASADQ